MSDPATPSAKIDLPQIDWPEAFEKAGPAGDPEIMLTASAKLGGIDFAVTAVRMHQGLRMPDYRDGVPKKVYEATLDSMVDDIENLTDSICPKLLPINGAHYLVWMVPTPAD